jgi:flagellar protein FlaG
MNERVSFSYHEGTNRVIMKVINPDTQEVIREVPAKNVIRLLEHIQEYIGMFVDESR